MMRKFGLYSTLLLGSFAAACGSTTTNPDLGGADMATAVAPNMPALSATQSDRIGRAGANTALTDPFDLTSGMTPDQVKASYNADANVAGWKAKYTAAIAFNLGILDSLNDKCGDQFAAGAMAVKGRYDALAGILADDQIYVNTGVSVCTQYLAVEAGLKTDCGGRTPLYDTIETTYSALAIGMLKGVTSGVTVDADAQASLTTFPFLAAPTN